MRRKLLAKTSWYRGKRKEDLYKEDGFYKKTFKERRQERAALENKTVLFVEYTEGGELATRLRELMRRLAPTIGFGVKVVERAGKKLKNMFPLTTLWDGVQCGREKECITCYQGAEKLVDCTKSSLVYENTCLLCNQGAAGKEELRELRQDVPTVYVGETSRSIQERGEEHWAGWRSQKATNHMYYHQTMEHSGEPPQFILKPVKWFRSALSRQLAEAVRIRRRGGEGAILNSRSEYNRCHISRLRLGEPIDEGAAAKEEEEEERRVNEESEELLQNWETDRVDEKAARARRLLGSRSSKVDKRKGAGSRPGRRTKKLKYEQLIGWGEEQVGEEQLQPPEHEGGGGPPCDDPGMTTRTEATNDERGPPSLTGRGEGQHGPDHQVHQGTFTGEEGGVPTQPQIWWKSQRKEGIQLKITDMMIKDDEKSLDNQTTMGGEPPGDRNNKLFDDEDSPEGNTRSISPNFVCIGEEEPGPVHTIPDTATQPSSQSCVWDDDEKYCMTHKCMTTLVKLTSKKWTWLNKKNCYGWTNKRVNKIICTFRKKANNKDKDIVCCSDTSDPSLGVYDKAGGDDKFDEVERVLFTDELSDRDRRVGEIRK